MEPQKKGVMYVYKLATGSQSPAVNFPETTKKEVLRGYWGLRKSKTYQENERGGGRRVVDGGVVNVDKWGWMVDGRWWCGECR